MSINELVQVSGVDVDVTVSKDDILAIAVSRYEQDLLEKDRILELRARELDKGLKAKRKDLSTEVERTARIQLVSKYDIAARALNDAGFGEFSVSIEPTLKSDKITVRISLLSEKDSYRSLNTTVDLSIPDKVTKLQAEIQVLDDDYRDACRERLEIKKSLSNIATQERLARARLAEKVLNGSEEGRKLLDALTTGDGPNVLALKG